MWDGWVGGWDDEGGWGPWRGGSKRVRAREGRATGQICFACGAQHSGIGLRRGHSTTGVRWTRWCVLACVCMCVCDDCAGWAMLPARIGRGERGGDGGDAQMSSTSLKTEAHRISLRLRRPTHRQALLFTRRCNVPHGGDEGGPPSLQTRTRPPAPLLHAIHGPHAFTIAPRLADHAYDAPARPDRWQRACTYSHGLHVCRQRCDGR